MGSGKTWFAKGFAKELGVEDHVTSPTFTLVHSYHGGRLPLHHADIYRLGRLSEVADLALAELLEEAGGGGVVLVEWGDVVEAALGNDLLEVRLWADPAEPEDRRHVALRAVGPAWAGRWERLCGATEAWRC
jgi:tRNA threonylcarbamoyladenosine biosynthesis protein TsaE